jgi:peptide/nickel transport system substrate-binding protein
MLTRRTLIGAAGAATPLLWHAAFRPAFAATPRDTVVMAKQIDDIISLDPHESFEFSGNEITGNIYEKLVLPQTADPTKIDGEIAERWDIGSDGLTYTFHLKGTNKFASGAPVTAEDCAFSIQRAVKMNKAPGFILTQFGWDRANVDAMVTAPDARTLVLKVGARGAPTFLLYCLSANVGSVVEKKVVLSHATGDDLGNAWLKSASAGSNAWVLRAWRPSESVSLDANPAHPMASGLKRLIILHRPDPSVQLVALQAGDVDIARNLQPEQLRTLAGKPDYAVVRQPKASLSYLAMNQKNPALAKPEVRQAIKYAIDYDAITRNITPDTYRVHQAFLPAGFPAALDDKPFAKDTAKAKALLAQAGVSNLELTLDCQSAAPWSDVAQAVQADLGAAGIKLTILPAEFRQVITKTRARQHQLAMLRWGSDYMDPHSNAETFCINTDNGDDAKNRTVAWRSAWQDQELTDRTAANVKQEDAKARVDEYIALQKLHQERSPFAIMLQEIEVAVMRKPTAGFEIGPLSDRTSYVRIKKA